MLLHYDEAPVTMVTGDTQLKYTKTQEIAASQLYKISKSDRSPEAPVPWGSACVMCCLDIHGLYCAGQVTWKQSSVLRFSFPDVTQPRKRAKVAKWAERKPHRPVAELAQRTSADLSPFA